MRILRKRGAKKGQFVILAAVTMALVILSLSVQIFGASNINQRVKFESYKEVVETVNSDYQNAFAFVLRDATRKRAAISNESELFTRFNEMSLTDQLADSTYGDKNLIGNATIEFLDSWAKVSKVALAGYGLAIDINTPSIKINYFWNGETANSSATANVAFNVTRIGLTGFKASHALLLEATIDSDDLDEQWAANDNVTNIRLKVTGLNGVAVNDLNLNNFAVYNLNSSAPGVWKASPLLEVVYKGLGIYDLHLAQHPIPPNETRYFLIVISDNSGILLLVSYHP